MSEKTNLQKFEEMAISLDGQWNAKQIGVIQNQVAKGTNLVELAYFLNIAKSVNLNPFNKEIWCYKDNKGNLLTFAGRDGFLKKAQESPDFAGIRSMEVKENDEFSMDVANNEIKHVIGKDDRGAIIGAYALVFRKDGEPTISYVEFKRYNKGYNTWKSHPEDMIKKVAESKALKLAFGISGIQVQEEFDIQDGVAIPREQVELETRKKITDEKFKQFLSNSDDFIERHINDLDLTEEQQSALNIRLDQNE